MKSLPIPAEVLTAAYLDEIKVDDNNVFHLIHRGRANTRWKTLLSKDLLDEILKAHEQSKLSLYNVIVTPPTGRAFIWATIEAEDEQTAYWKLFNDKDWLKSILKPSDIKLELTTKES